jgi:hypothetical protein
MFSDYSGGPARRTPPKKAATHGKRQGMASTEPKPFVYSMDDTDDGGKANLWQTAPVVAASTLQIHDILGASANPNLVKAATNGSPSASWEIDERGGGGGGGGRGGGGLELPTAAWSARFDPDAIRMEAGEEDWRAVLHRQRTMSEHLFAKRGVSKR